MYYTQASNKCTELMHTYTPLKHHVHKNKAIILYINSRQNEEMTALLYKTANAIMQKHYTESWVESNTLQESMTQIRYPEESLKYATGQRNENTMLGSITQIHCLES